MKKILTSLLILFSLQSLPAVVQTFNQVLHDSSNSYTVPAGKVLIIEHFIWALEGDSTHQVISIRPNNDPAGVGDFLLKFSTDTPDSYTPPRPIRLAAGGIVMILYNPSGADWRDVLVIGLLVDEEDQYAANIDTQLRDVQVDGERLLAQATFASPRPRVVRVESSTQLSGFDKDPEAAVEETLDPKLAVVSVPKNPDKTFMRVETVARNKE
jgi:hypothetical protein